MGSIHVTNWTNWNLSLLSTSAGAVFVLFGAAFHPAARQPAYISWCSAHSVLGILFGKLGPGAFFVFFFRWPQPVRQRSATFLLSVTPLDSYRYCCTHNYIQGKKTGQVVHFYCIETSCLDFWRICTLEAELIWLPQATWAFQYTFCMRSPWGAQFRAKPPTANHVKSGKNGKK